MNDFPNEVMVNCLSYLDVRTLVEIKLVSRQWQHLSTTAIDNKGIGTTRKAFETNHELRNAVVRYCPNPTEGDDMDDETTTTTTTTTMLYYCNREIAEDIACTYGWPITKWDVSQLQDFSFLFRGGDVWNEDRHTFDNYYGIALFNEDISKWNVSKAMTMTRMFCGTLEFNQDVSTWDVSNVLYMDGMFYNAKEFNQDLSTWDVSNVISMTWMFSGTIQFNQNLSNWNVSNVTSMEGMFHDASQFNQDIISSWEGWDVTKLMIEEEESESEDSDNSVLRYGSSSSSSSSSLSSGEE